MNPAYAQSRLGGSLEFTVLPALRTTFLHGLCCRPFLGRTQLHLDKALFTAWASSQEDTWLVQKKPSTFKFRQPFCLHTEGGFCQPGSVATAVLSGRGVCSGRNMGLC